MSSEWDEAYNDLTRLVERIRENDSMTEDEIHECVENAIENTRPATAEELAIQRPKKPKR